MEYNYQEIGGTLYINKIIRWICLDWKNKMPKNQKGA